MLKNNKTKTNNILTELDFIKRKEPCHIVTALNSVEKCVS